MVTRGKRLVEWDYWLNDRVDHEVVWTRSNVKDQCPKPIAPLTQQLFKYEHDGCMIVLRDVFGLLPPGTDWDPMVGTFYGQLFTNVEGNIRVGAVLPGTNPHEHLEQFFGLERDPTWVPPVSAPLEQEELDAQATFVARLIELVPDLPRAIDEQLNRVRSARPGGDIELITDESLIAWLRTLESLAAGSFAMLIRAAMLGGAMYAMTSGVLQSLDVSTDGGLLNSLHADLGQNESAEMGRAVLRLAAIAARDREAFDAVKQDPRLRWVTDDNASQLVAEWQRFIERFGHRGPGELALENPSWRSDPSTLVAAVELAMRSSNDGDEHASSLREEAQRSLADQMGGHVPDHLVDALERSRSAMSQRENGKGPIVLVFDELRRLLAVAGPRLVGRGRVRRSEQLLFFRFAELEQVLRGEPGPDEAELDARAAAFECCLAVDLPEIVVSTPEGDLRALDPMFLIDLGFLPPGPSVIGSEVLEGVAGSAGDITGVARVMTGPWDDFEPGEILVANTVDPGWAPILACAAAIVLDLGGTMSHGVVVARELGIPCVVNVRVATKVVESGSQVRVDGTRGLVHLRP